RAVAGRVCPPDAGGTDPHGRGCCQCRVLAVFARGWHDYRPYPRGGWGLLHFRMNSPNLADSGLSDGVAIVTGGSRGIGRAIVELLAASGMDVIFTYRENTAAAAEVVAAGKGSKITAEVLDIRDAPACAAFVEKVVDRTGRIDLLV